MRNQVGLVQQEPKLFSGTITENITLGMDNVSLKEVIQACEWANAKKFVENLPEVSEYSQWKCSRSKVM